MGCNTYVVGVRDLDADFKEMITIVKMCKKKNISLPKEVIEYFEPLEESWDSIEDIDEIDQDEIAKHMGEVSLTYDLKIKGLVEGEVEYGDGMVIDLSKLPNDIKKLRVYMSC